MVPNLSASLRPAEPGRCVRCPRTARRNGWCPQGISLPSRASTMSAASGTSSRILTPWRGGPRKSKSRVVVGVPQDGHEAFIPLPCRVEGRADGERSRSSSLMLGGHRARPRHRRRYVADMAPCEKRVTSGLTAVGCGHHRSPSIQAGSVRSVSTRSASSAVSKAARLIRRTDAISASVSGRVSQCRMRCLTPRASPSVSNSTWRQPVERRLRPVRPTCPGPRPRAAARPCRAAPTGWTRS